MAQSTAKKRTGVANATTASVTPDDRAAGASLNRIAMQAGGSVQTAKQWGALPEFTALTKRATPERWGALLTGAFAMHHQDEFGGEWGRPSRWGKAIGVTSKTCTLINEYCSPSLVDLLSRRKVSLTPAQFAVYAHALARWLPGRDRGDFGRLKKVVIEWAKANPGRNVRDLTILANAVEHSHRHRVFYKDLRAAIRAQSQASANVKNGKQLPPIRSGTAAR
jgi:hypothetical protein